MLSAGQRRAGRARGTRCHRDDLPSAAAAQARGKAQREAHLEDHRRDDRTGRHHHLARPQQCPELAQETRDRVQKIAAEIGYLPDRAALRLKTGRTNVISLILEPDEQIYGLAPTSSPASPRPARHGLSPCHHAAVPQCPRRSNPSATSCATAWPTASSSPRPKRSTKRVRFLLDNDFPFVSHGRTQCRRRIPS